jgi:hypothetical protein
MWGKRKTRWRRPQFSLAAFFIFIAIIVQPLAYIQYHRSWNTKRIAARPALVRQGVRFTATPVDPDGGLWQSLKHAIFLTDNYQAFELSVPPARGEPSAVAENDLRLLAYFPEVEAIWLGDGTHVDDEKLKVLASLPNLKHLELANLQKVTGTFMASLPENSRLESLRLRRLENLSARELSTIGRLAHLKRLMIEDTPKLNAEMLGDVDLPSAVEELSLRNSNLDEALIHRWVSQAKLKSLYLRAPISRRFAPALANQFGLEALVICDAPLLDCDFQFLGQCRLLRQLELTAMPTAGSFLQWLPCPEKLERLELHHTLLRDEHLPALAPCFLLSHVDFSFCPITGVGFRGKSDWPRLEVFRVYGTQFSEEGKASFKQFEVYPRYHLDFPANWTEGDLKEFHAARTNAVRIELLKAARGEFSGRNMPFAIPQLDLANLDQPLMNCPAELMRPVIRLRELARDQETQQRDAGK